MTKAIDMLVNIFFLVWSDIFSHRPFLLVGDQEIAILFDNVQVIVKVGDKLLLMIFVAASIKLANIREK